MILATGVTVFQLIESDVCVSVDRFTVCFVSLCSCYVCNMLSGIDSVCHSDFVGLSARRHFRLEKAQSFEAILVQMELTQYLLP